MGINSNAFLLPAAVMMTFALDSVKAIAVALPIPEVPPVTRTTLS